MKIEVKCFSSLAERHACHYGAPSVLDLSDGDKVQDAIDAVGVPAEKVKITFVNGRAAARQDRLRHGDRIALVPATGGM